MSEIEDFLEITSSVIWGDAMLILLIGGGLFFTIYSKFVPFKHFTHAIKILGGKYDQKAAPGEISHFQALSTALSGTIGMGNISGVALAIASGGPGALFWMWMSAFLGMSTKYFTCTLAVLYRGRDENGNPQGGPMYVIREGLHKNWYGLAVFFCVAGIIGSSPIFQINQMAAVLKEGVLLPLGFEDGFKLNLILGIVFALIVGAVIIGGIKRIASVASRLVPFMVLLYVLGVMMILLINFDKILPSFGLIFHDAFTAQSILGGSLGMLMKEGVKRAAFSNEAGIGNAPMIHGAAKTSEPVREGLVAMLGPAIDTIIVCTMTGLCIIVTGAWTSKGINGVEMTSLAFESALPGLGSYMLMIIILIFGITTIFGFSYYGQKCLAFLIGARYGVYFQYWHVFSVIIGAVSSLNIVVNLLFIGFGLMAIPTMISTLLLSPKVWKATRDYFSKPYN